MMSKIPELKMQISNSIMTNASFFTHLGHNKTISFLICGSPPMLPTSLPLKTEII